MAITNPTVVKALTVSAYAAQIQRTVKAVGAAVVEGEVQKPRESPGGTLMFDLTDGDSTLKAKVPPWTMRRGIRHEPRDGELVRLTISEPDFWPKAGTLSVNVQDIELAGDGELLRRRSQLIARLRKEGLTEEANFPGLPRFPATIGLIAGANSSGLEDVLRALADRFPAARVITACCQVQGAGAPRAVIDSLARLDLLPEVEVIIVSRGGGSPRDLMAFDDEGLCRAISALCTPVVAAIGHTDNIPVCNYVTHSALTPSRVAELVVPDRAALLAEFDEADAGAARALRAFRKTQDDLDARCQALRGAARIGACRGRVIESGRVVDASARRFIADVTGATLAARERLTIVLGSLRERFLAPCECVVHEFAEADARAVERPQSIQMEVDQLSGRLAGSAGRIMRDRKANWILALDRQGETLSAATHRRLGATEADTERQAQALPVAAKRRLEAIGHQADSLVAILQASDFRRRGWLLATAPDGRSVTSVAQVSAGDRLRLHLHDGEVDAVADKVKSDSRETP